MTYSVAEIRRWNTGILGGASRSVESRTTAVGDCRRALDDGAGALDEGWAGRAADAVLGAADQEKSHVTKLLVGLEDLADVLQRAGNALGPAVQAVRDRIADAEVGGLEVDGSVVRPVYGRDDVTEAAVNAHAEAIGDAVGTVRSLDEHYGREIDVIAEMLHNAIPPEVDRSAIPGPGDPWPGRAVDAMTGAMSEGLPKLADELDPEARGRHMRNPAPDDFGRKAAAGLRGLGKLAGPVGTGMTVYGGVEGYVRGETTAGEAVVETAGAVGGGIGGGAAAGAAAGSFLGPLGAIVGAGIGAAVGSYLGQKAADEGYEAVMGNG